MADFKHRVAEGVPGKVYVDWSCLDCDVCRDCAPTIFTRNNHEGVSYVFKQPETEAEWVAVQEAVDSCPIESIGNDGDTQNWSNEGEQLVTSAALGNIDQVQYLLENGIDPNSIHPNKTALMAASQMLNPNKTSEYIRIVEMLLKNGAHPNVKKFWGETALYYASGCREGLPIVRLLLIYGANPDADFRRNSLQEAIRYKFQDIVDCLTEWKKQVTDNLF